MTHDRTCSDHFHLTHEILAFMPGMRRVGIAKTVGALHDRNLISYRRGMITILDRAGLEAASCACYRIDRDVYTGLLGR